MTVHPDHTTLQAAHAELDRFDRYAAHLNLGLATPLLREPLEELVRLVIDLDTENDRLAGLLMDDPTTDGHTTNPHEVF